MPIEGNNTTTGSLRQVIKRELKKSYLDPVYFLKKFTRVEHPTRGKIPFNLYKFQEDTLHQFNQHRFNIVLKSRQMGISTLCAGHVLHKMIFNDGYKVLVIATTQEVAKAIVTKVKVMYDSLPAFFKEYCKLVDNNKLEMSFTNGSHIKSVSSSPDAARSVAASLLVIDEAAFIEKFEDIWTASQMTLATGGDAIVLSTPNGMGNQFHSMWVKAEQGIAEEGLEKFNPIILRWDLHPDRDEKWRKQQDELLGPRMAAQETDCSFVSSGATVVDGEILQWYLDNTVKEPLEKRGIGGDYWIWEYPDYTKKYMVIADVSRGDSADYSTFHVFNALTLEQCAEFKGMIGTRQFAAFLMSVATDYNKALLVIPNRNMGWDVVNEVIQLGYNNLFYSYKNDPYLDENIHIRKNYDLRDKSEKVPGFTETNPVRVVCISKIITYLLEKSVQIKSKRTIQELQVFIWLNGKAQAAPGYNDDLVIPYSIGLYMHDIALKLHTIGIDLTRTAIQKSFKSVYKPNRTSHPSWEIDMGNKKESLTWLL